MLPQVCSCSCYGLTKFARALCLASEVFAGCTYGRHFRGVDPPGFEADPGNSCRNSRKQGEESICSKGSLLNDFSAEAYRATADKTMRRKDVAERLASRSRASRGTVFCFTVAKLDILFVSNRDSLLFSRTVPLFDLASGSSVRHRLAKFKLEQVRNDLVWMSPLRCVWVVLGLV